MYLMYVDESGDPGNTEYSSAYFILSGLIISQEEWANFLSRLKTFRKYLSTQYKLNQRTEIHAKELIRVGSIENYKLIRKTDRINILKDCATQFPIIFDTAKVINICLDKAQFDPSTSFQELAWGRLIQRYDTYLKKTAKDKGIIISDDTDGKVVMNTLRKMRIYNPVPSHFSTRSYNAPTDSIVEDIFQRSSHHSYFVQTVDVIAHLLYRKEYPKGSLKKYGLEKLFDNFEPILLKKAASADKMGIVRK